MFEGDPNFPIYVSIGSVVLLAAVLLVIFLWSFRRTSGGARDLQGDLANMMILLQTMRDMLDQQKDLARQLNSSVDRKVAMIRHVVKAAADAHDELCQAQRALAEHLRQAKTDLEAIESRSDALRRKASNGEHPPPARAPVAEVVIPEPASVPVPVDAASSAAREEDVDLVDDWVGLEVAQPVAAPEPVSESPPEPLGESSEEAHAARDAFRMLLNMAAATQTPVPPAPEPHGLESEQRGNGHDDRMAANRQVSSEYSDAGMSVSDIARELGMGKGEVRLILGLRKEEERKV